MQNMKQQKSRKVYHTTFYATPTSGNHNKKISKLLTARAQWRGMCFFPMSRRLFKFEYIPSGNVSCYMSRFDAFNHATCKMRYDVPRFACVKHILPLQCEHSMTNILENITWTKRHIYFDYIYPNIKKNMAIVFQDGVQVPGFWNTFSVLRKLCSLPLFFSC